MRNQSSAKRKLSDEHSQSLADSFASIAQSFREYVELYRANSDREAAKNRRPGVVRIGRATYQREENPETQSEVPGMRLSGKIPDKNEISRLAHKVVNTRTKQAQ